MIQKGIKEGICRWYTRPGNDPEQKAFPSSLTDNKNREKTLSDEFALEENIEVLSHLSLQLL